MVTKLMFTAAIMLAALLSAKAQTVEVIADCNASKLVHLNRVNARGERLENHNIGSHCPQQETPPYRIAVGNYEIDNHIPENEEWLAVVLDVNGKQKSRTEIDPAKFFVMVGPKETLRIIISEKMMVVEKPISLGIK